MPCVLVPEVSSNQVVLFTSNVLSREHLGRFIIFSMFLLTFGSKGSLNTNEKEKTNSESRQVFQYEIYFYFEIYFF